jgi:hypothetical protein
MGKRKKKYTKKNRKNRKNNKRITNKRKYKGGAPNTDCPICFILFDRFDPEFDPADYDDELEEIIELNCGHIIHKECAIQWCILNNRECPCPICRVDILTEVSPFLEQHEPGPIPIGMPPPPPPPPMAEELFGNTEENALHSLTDYFNRRLKSSRKPYEKLQFELGLFLNTENMPFYIFNPWYDYPQKKLTKILVFELKSIGKSRLLHKYKFDSILQSKKDIPYFRGKKKYFQYKIVNLAEDDDDAEDDIDVLYLDELIEL